MSFIDLFPTIIHYQIVDSIPKNELSIYQKIVESLEFKIDDNGNSSYSLEQNLFKKSIFKNLETKILDSSKKYFDEIGHEYEDLQICNSWANSISKQGIIHNHTHPNSYLSGCFYFDKSSPIIFTNPIQHKWSFDPVRDQHVSNKETDNHREWARYVVMPEKNSLLLFPSWLWHTVAPSWDDKRLTIAFNIVPKGVFGRESARLNFPKL